MTTATPDSPASGQAAYDILLAAEPEEITPEIVEKHGLTEDEYAHVKEILGREPNYTELGIFSVMWSEHCSYKNSRPQLKKFPTEGPSVLVKAGEENAGVIDIGGGLAVAFKMESHNHPSAVEPFQGAATGVGGILRDIFTMGARPVFSMNSLRFGEIRGWSADAKTNRRLFAGVVSGIAHYGNCIGVPTIGGEVYFDPSYQANPLVNVFNLGVLRHDQIKRGAASGVGNPVYYVGNRTGRDGLAGAAFASRDLTEESQADRPAVQVGDPFIEKLLLEACLELFEHEDAVVGVQDMGAAGLTCSTCETASRGGTGVEIDLNLVPRREPNLTPYEIMLSESQERMLIIVKAGREEVVEAIFDKWDLPAAKIGTVTDDGMMRVKVGEVTVAEIPAAKLADDAPVYQRESKEPADLAQRQAFDYASAIPEPALPDLQANILKLISSPSLASKRWVYRQYDHMVRVGTVVYPGGDAAVFRIACETPDGAADNESGSAPEPEYRYLAASVDCNGQYCSLDPENGARLAVAEAARNLAMVGARPLAVTDNLNFGNPHNPENFWQIEKSVDGLAEACRFFETPVTGGNVSLYNQSPAGAIDPTPTVGMVGLIDDPKHITSAAFQNEGDAILLLGTPGSEMGASAYAREIHNQRDGKPPVCDLETEKRLHDGVRALIRLGEIRSAHDLAEGGLVLALVESCLGGRNGAGTALAPDGVFGAAIDLDLADGERWDVALLNESQARAIVTCRRENAAALTALAERSGIPARQIGVVTKPEDGLVIRRGGAVEESISYTLEELESAWGESIQKLMEG